MIIGGGWAWIRSRNNVSDLLNNAATGQGSQSSSAVSKLAMQNQLMPEMMPATWCAEMALHQPPTHRQDVGGSNNDVPNVENRRRQQTQHGRVRSSRALPVPTNNVVKVGDLTPITAILAEPVQGLQVLAYQTFTLHRTLLPVEAVAVKVHGEGKQEILFCDLATHNAFVFDASDGGELRTRPLTPLAKPEHLVGKLQKPSSLSLTMDGMKIGVKDDDGVHFFDASSKTYLTSTMRLKSMYGLEVFDENFFVTLDDDAPSFVFIDMDMEEIVNRRVSLRSIDRSSGDTPSETRRRNRRGDEMSKFRFVAIDHHAVSGLKRAAITDWGLNRVHVLDFTTGKVLYTVGGFGRGLGQFHDPAGVAFLPNGLLAVADRMNGRIQTFGPGGSFEGLIQLPSAVTQPVGLFLMNATGGTNRKDLYVTHYRRQPGITKLTLSFDE